MTTSESATDGNVRNHENVVTGSLYSSLCMGAMVMCGCVTVRRKGPERDGGGGGLIKSNNPATTLAVTGATDGQSKLLIRNVLMSLSRAAEQELHVLRCEFVQSYLVVIDSPIDHVRFLFLQ